MVGEKKQLSYFKDILYDMSCHFADVKLDNFIGSRSPGKKVKKARFYGCSLN